MLESEKRLHFHEFQGILCCRFIKLEQMSKKSLENLEKDNVDVSLEAGVSASTVGSVSVNAAVSTSKENSNKFNSALKNEQIITIGSKLPADGEM